MPEIIQTDEVPVAVSSLQENGDTSPLCIIAPAAPQRINPNERHDMKDIVPSDYQGLTTEIEIPSYGFVPDQWSKAFQRGLQRLDIAGKTLVEPGVGTGLNIGYLASRSKSDRPKAIWNGDYDPRMPKTAARNCDRMLTPEARSIVHPCEGSLSLISWLKRNNVRPDLVYGCLPQVQCPDDIVLGTRDSLSHYFKAPAGEKIDQHTKDMNDFGLRLQVMLLQEARTLLTKNGQVVLNLGGRPGKDVLTKMFEQEGFQAKILHAEIIEQHEGTNLQKFADREDAVQHLTGHKFEFFRDPLGKDQIDAAEAQRLKLSKQPVYHYIYVVRGTMA